MEDIAYKTSSCFMCRRNPEEFKLTEITTPNVKLAFKLLLRYLNVETGKQNSTQPSSSQIDELVSEPTFCNMCSELLQDFWEWHGILEAVRLLLTKSIWKLYYRMAKSDEDDDSENLDTLRKETLKKCKAKLLSNPKIVLPRISIQVYPVDEPVIQEGSRSKCPNSSASANLLNARDKKEKTDFACDFCPTKFRLWKFLRRHKIRKHSLLLFSDKFPTSTSKTELEGAINDVIHKHGNNQRDTKCLRCKKPFKTRIVFRRHLLIRHLNEVIFVLKEEIRRKLKASKKSKKIKLYVCYRCEKSFQTKNALQRHKKKHNKISQIKTIQLVKTEGKVANGNHSQNVDNLQQYNSALTYKCTFCKRAYKRKDKLNSHVKLQHTFLRYEKILPRNVTAEELEGVISGFMVVQPDKALRCKKCQKVYFLRHYLKVHILRNYLSYIIAELKCNAKKRYRGEGSSAHGIQKTGSGVFVKREIICEDSG